MAKKKGLAARHSSARKNKGLLTAKANPPPIEDLVEFVVPGFVGYAGTRLTARVVQGIAARRFPRLAKHLGVASTFASAGLAWLLVHRFEKVKQYHTPVVVGASIAAIQSAVQTYLPKYGWIVSDVQQLPAGSRNGAQAPSSIATAPAPAPALSFQSSRSLAAPQPAAGPMTSQASRVETADDLVDELEDLDLGSFETDLGDGTISDAEIDELLMN